MDAGPTSWGVLLAPYRADLYVEQSFVKRMRNQIESSESPPKLQCPIVAVVAVNDESISRKGVVEAWGKGILRKYNA